MCPLLLLPLLQQKIQGKKEKVFCVLVYTRAAHCCTHARHQENFIQFRTTARELFRETLTREKERARNHFWGGKGAKKLPTRGNQIASSTESGSGGDDRCIISRIQTAGFSMNECEQTRATIEGDAPPIFVRFHI